MSLTPHKVVATTLGSLLLIAVTTALLFRDQLTLQLVSEWMEQSGQLAIPLFILGYALIVVTFLPATLVSIAAGALFGPLWGTLFSATGATIGALFAFLLSRYLFSDWVKSHANRHSDKVVHCVNQEGWRFVAFVRLVPLFPYNLSNYLFGITSLSAVTFSWATLLFILPGTVARTYIGHVGIETLSGSGEQIVLKIGIAATLFALVAFLPSIIRTVQRELLNSGS